MRGELFQSFEHPAGWNWPTIVIDDFEQAIVHPNVAEARYSVIGDQYVSLRKHKVGVS